MNTTPCEHPRQALKDLFGAEAEDGPMFCAAPGCPAGPGGGAREWVGKDFTSDHPNVPTFKRVEASGVWKWIPMPIVLGHAAVPDDFDDWLTPQVRRLEELGCTAIETTVPFKPGDVLGIKMTWKGEAMEYSVRFDGEGPLWGRGIDGFKRVVERFPPAPQLP